VSGFFEGGTSRGQARLRRFLQADLDRYGDVRLEPDQERVSHLSPYLHFGQISPLDVALGARAQGGGGTEAFLEELIVRRELAANYCEHEPDYDRYRALPGWAKETLAAHADDERPHVYTANELERAQTDDPYWNASMDEMRYTGYLHNAMRMYWGKRILAWTRTPEHAFRVTLELNNRYLLDGRDTSSYANVAWVFGLHDRAFAERDVFGKVRTMTSGGLERKYNMDAYCEAVRDKVARARAMGVRFD
jgi:deoxyribodipyrimidine photo-lyase